MQLLELLLDCRLIKEVSRLNKQLHFRCREYICKQAKPFLTQQAVLLSGERGNIGDIDIIMVTIDSPDAVGHSIYFLERQSLVPLHSPICTMIIDVRAEVAGKG